MAPSDGICFNLEDLFASNNTLNSTGYYNYTGNLYAVPWPISYSLTNIEAFDASANYSNIRYQQTNATGNGESGSGDAVIALQIYPARNCRDAPPEAPLSAFYGWSCQSEEEGQCRTAEYSVKSIMISDASSINAREWQDKCWDFAQGGGANGLERSSVWMLLLGSVAAALMAA
ncbi:unnamed protein product [Cercospora beticola]|nr:unnamed protein product [Cercospora beticola]